MWPFSTQLQSTPGPEATVIDAAGTERTGVNFASYDYLGLSTHTEVRAAAIEAINQYGTAYRRSADIAGKLGSVIAAAGSGGGTARTPTCCLVPHRVGGRVWRHHGLDPHQGPRRS